MGELLPFNNTNVSHSNVNQGELLTVEEYILRFRIGHLSEEACREQSQVFAWPDMPKEHLTVKVLRKYVQTMNIPHGVASVFELNKRWESVIGNYEMRKEVTSTFVLDSMLKNAIGIFLCRLSKK